jgi:predicted dehydrogenase
LRDFDLSARAIRWGILGTGAVARAFALDLRLVPGATIGAIGSRRLDRAREFARQFGAARIHDTVAGLAGDDELDVVYVATPHARHRDDCLACLSMGRPVLCEKPFTLTAAQAGAVIVQARASQTFCMEAMWMRFHPLIQRARAIVHSGAIGAVRLLIADCGYPTAFSPENRFFDVTAGGGALMERGVYAGSLAYFLLGVPAQVTGEASIGSTGVDEQQSAILTYPGGALAVLTSSLRSRLRNEALIVGTMGQIRIHEPFFAPRRLSLLRFEEPVGSARQAHSSVDWKGRIKRIPLVRRAFDTLGTPLVRLLRRGGATMVHYGAGEGYQFEAAEVIRCLRAGQLESPIMPLDETRRILETTDCLRRSWGLLYPGE